MPACAGRTSALSSGFLLSHTHCYHMLSPDVHTCCRPSCASANTSGTILLHSPSVQLPVPPVWCSGGQAGCWGRAAVAWLLAPKSLQNREGEERQSKVQPRARTMTRLALPWQRPPLTLHSDPTEAVLALGWLCGVSFVPQLCYSCHSWSGCVEETSFSNGSPAPKLVPALARLGSRPFLVSLEAVTPCCLVSHKEIPGDCNIS